MNVKNQLTSVGGSSCTHDSNCNLTNDPSRTFSYDDENQLTQVIYPNSYRIGRTYDGRLRLRKRTEYTWNGARDLGGGLSLHLRRDAGNSGAG